MKQNRVGFDLDFAIQQGVANPQQAGNFPALEQTAELEAYVGRLAEGDSIFDCLSRSIYLALNLAYLPAQTTHNALEFSFFGLIGGGVNYPGEAKIQ